MKNKKTKKEEIDITQVGAYRLGLTTKEIKEYLAQRANIKDKATIDTIYKKFQDVAGINTIALQTCELCNKQIRLMYRWDVKRYADYLFDGKSTYWD